jgi:hypothetical protein
VGGKESKRDTRVDGKGNRLGKDEGETRKRGKWIGFENRMRLRHGEEGNKRWTETLGQGTGKQTTSGRETQLERLKTR